MFACRCMMRFDVNQGIFRILKNGKRGDDVAQLQIRLYELGCYDSQNVVVDGVFGSATEEAVKNFQRRRGITADGIVGAATYEKLYGEYLREDRIQRYRDCDYCSPAFTGNPD